jgi:hypothetical protein
LTQTSVLSIVKENKLGSIKDYWDRKKNLGLEEKSWSRRKILGK